MTSGRALIDLELRVLADEEVSVMVVSFVDLIVKKLGLGYQKEAKGLATLRLCAHYHQGGAAGLRCNE